MCAHLCSRFDWELMDSVFYAARATVSHLKHSTQATERLKHMAEGYGLDWRMLVQALPRVAIHMAHPNGVIKRVRGSH